MRKMLERCNSSMKKLDDKGFSLVELIIVIAIMAVLVAILAPQYTKYVEKSRKSADISAADSIIGACKTVAIDPEYYDTASKGFTVTWDISIKTGNVTAVPATLTTAITELVGADVAAKSKFATTSGNLEVKVDSDGNVTITKAWADAMEGYTSTATPAPTT